MTLNSVWKTSENSATAAWELGDADELPVQLTVATDTPLAGGALQVGAEAVSLLALEKKGEGDSPLDLTCVETIWLLGSTAKATHLSVKFTGV